MFQLNIGSFSAWFLMKMGPGIGHGQFLLCWISTRQGVFPKAWIVLLYELEQLGQISFIIMSQIRLIAIIMLDQLGYVSLLNLVRLGQVCCGGGLVGWNTWLCLTSTLDQSCFELSFVRVQFGQKIILQLETYQVSHNKVYLF